MSFPGEMPPQVARPRRSQAERRAHTRQAILDAALASLQAHGIAGFTTPDVCARAGVSQGSVFNHFGTKDALIAAAVEHLFDQLRAAYAQRFLALPPAERTREASVHVMWQVMDDPRLLLAYELYTASRTDRALNAALEPVVRAHVDGIQALAERLFPEDAARDRELFHAAIELAVLAMQGLVINRLVVPDEAVRQRLLALLVGLMQEKMP